jgi:hypothetical protein
MLIAMKEDALTDLAPAPSASMHEGVMAPIVRTAAGKNLTMLPNMKVSSRRLPERGPNFNAQIDEGVT